MNMPILEEKKTYFDNYWREQSTEIADPRGRQRAMAVLSLLDKKSGRLLDVGCGRGIALDFFAYRGFDVTGVDISPEAVNMVKKKGHQAYIIDLERDEIPGKYDFVLCLEVLQQLYDPSKLLNKLKSSLAPNGEMLVSLPNEFHIVSRLRILFGLSHLGDFRHSHIRMFTPSRDRTLFKSADLNIVREICIPIIPPKWKILSTIFKPLTQIFPSLLAISSIYRLKKK